MVTSGIRIGSPALTTRGMTEPEMQVVGEWIGQILNDPQNEQLGARIKAQVRELTARFPLYEWRLRPDGVSA